MDNGTLLYETRDKIKNANDKASLELILDFIMSNVIGRYPIDTMLLNEWGAQQERLKERENMFNLSLKDRGKK